MKPRLIQADDSLDRRSASRGDTALMSLISTEPDARFTLFDGLQPMLGVTAGTGLPHLWFGQRQVSQLRDGLEPLVFLGIDRVSGAGRFAARITEGARRRIDTLGPLEPPEDFRSIASQGRLPHGEVSAAALARSLFAWQDAHRFCGSCGSQLTLIDAGWRARCNSCERDLYPRVDPVVIMLVTDGERCVLAHEPRFPEGMVSCIAGYIEPGEDVAHAVRRETFEELALAVEQVEFLASQPWPFPHSLMIGCVARVAPAEPTPDPSEIVFARWFERAEVRAMLERKHPDGLWEPGAQSIAHHLIAAFADGRA